MRFTHPAGNPTAILDRAEGRLYHLAGVNAIPGDKESKAISAPMEAALLIELLNTMHERIISRDSGDNFSRGKDHTGVPCPKHTTGGGPCYCSVKQEKDNVTET